MSKAYASILTQNSSDLIIIFIYEKKSPRKRCHKNLTQAWFIKDNLWMQPTYKSGHSIFWLPKKCNVPNNFYSSPYDPDEKIIKCNFS